MWMSGLLARKEARAAGRNSTIAEMLANTLTWPCSPDACLRSSSSSCSAWCKSPRARPRNACQERCPEGLFQVRKALDYCRCDGMASLGGPSDADSLGDRHEMLEIAEVKMQGPTVPG